MHCRVPGYHEILMVEYMQQYCDTTVLYESQHACHQIKQLVQLSVLTSVTSQHCFITVWRQTNIKIAHKTGRACQMPPLSSQTDATVMVFSSKHHYNAGYLQGLKKS